MILVTINPITRGWANYYRGGVGLRRHGPLHVAAHLQMGLPPPPRQTDREPHSPDEREQWHRTTRLEGLA
jgi:hypothetical protein